MEKIKISLFKEDIKELEESINEMTEREQTVMYAYGKNVEEYGKAIQDLTKDTTLDYTKEQPNARTSTPYGTLNYQGETIAKVLDIDALNEYIRELGGDKTTEDFKIKEQKRSAKVVSHTTFKA